MILPSQNIEERRSSQTLQSQRACKTKYIWIKSYRMIVQHTRNPECSINLELSELTKHSLCKQLLKWGFWITSIYRSQCSKPAWWHIYTWWYVSVSLNQLQSHKSIYSQFSSFRRKHIEFKPVYFMRSCASYKTDTAFLCSYFTVEWWENVPSPTLLWFPHDICKQ